MGESLADPLPLLALTLAVGSVLWATWRRCWLPLAAVLPYVLIMPLLNPKYEPLHNGRYLAPFLPFVFAALGVAAGDAWRAVGARGHRSALVGLGALALVALAAYPLIPLAHYAQSTGRTNRAVIAAYQAVLAHRQPDETVLLDARLDDVRYMAAGSAYKSMELLLDASDVPFAVVNARPATIEEALGGHASRLALLHGDDAAPLGRRFALNRLGPTEPGAGFGLYRIARRL